MSHGYAGIDNELYVHLQNEHVLRRRLKALAEMTAAVKTLIGA
jgi:hypothetical protein